MISPSVSYIFNDWVHNTMTWISSSTSAMDVQTVIICGGVFVISAIVVYLISAFGMRERTYEEAMEEQRRRNQEAMQHSKNDKTKKDKKYKKWGKRSKEKSEEERSQTCDGNSKVAPDEAEVKGDSGSNSSNQNSDLKVSTKKKIRQRKSSQMAKEENRSQQLSSSEDTDELPSSCSLPLQASKEDSKDLVSEKTVKTKEDFGVQSLESQNDHQSDFHDKAEMTEVLKPIKKSPTKKKRNKVDTPESGSECSEWNEAKLLNTIKKAGISDDELQTIIDPLSTHQIINEKRKNEIASLKKLIQEKEDALKTEQKSCNAANEKISDLIQELNETKAQASAIEKSLRTAVNQEQQEIKGLHDMMQRKQKHYSDEIAALQSKMKKMKNIMKEEHAIAIQRLQEENSQLQSLNRMESEKNQRSSMEISRLQHEIDQLRSSREKFENHQAAMQQSQEDLHHQIQQLEQIISSHQEEDYSYKQRINEMSNKIQQAENARSSLVQELQNAQTVCSSLESDNSTLRQRLEEAKHQLNNSEQSVLQLQNSLEESTLQQRDLANCLDEQVQIIKTIKQENEVLVSQVNQRLSDNADKNQPNGDLSEKARVIELEEHEAVLKEKENMIHHLMQELDQHSSECKNLLNEIAHEKKNNEELSEKNSELSKALQTAQGKLQEVITSAEMKVQEAQKKVDKTSQDMQILLKEQIKEVEIALQESFSKELKNAHQETENVKKEAEEKISKIESQANLRLEEFQESLYERLNQLNSEAEFKIQETVKEKEEIKSQQEALKISIRKFLQNIFPNLNIPDHIDNTSFLKNYESEVKAYIDALKKKEPSNNNELESMRKKLEEKALEKTNLESQISVYENVLYETESILKTLQNNIETEEKKWASELQIKEEAMNEIKSEVEELKLENRNLRISLEQLQDLKESLFEIEELKLKLHKEETDKKMLQEKIRMLDAVSKPPKCPVTENNFLQYSEVNSNILPNKSEKRKKSRKRGNSGKK